MKIILAPLRNDLLKLLQIDSPLVSIFYFNMEDMRPIYDDIGTKKIYILRFEYNDTFENAFDDEVREGALFEALYELKDEEKSIILTVPIHHFQKIQNLIVSEIAFNQFEIQAMKFPANNEHLNLHTWIYREEINNKEKGDNDEESEVEGVYWEIDELYPFLGELIQSDLLGNKYGENTLTKIRNLN